MVSKIKKIASSLKWQAIHKADISKKTFFVITRQDDFENPQIVCADNIIIDPENITIEWVASPFCDDKKLQREGWL